jgi:hypothetical protein
MWTPRRRSSILPLLAVPVLVLGACSTTRMLDRDAVGDLIVEAVEEGIGLTPTNVSCPEVEDPDDGTTFECTATLDGQTLRIDGVVTDADEGTVEVVNADAVLFVDLLEATIADDFGVQLGFPVSVDCGDTVVRVEQVGARFTCSATDEIGDEADVQVDVLDVEGNIAYELG